MAFACCTRAARKENPNPNSHDHCLLSSGNVVRVRILICATIDNSRVEKEFTKLYFGGRISLSPLPLKLSVEDKVTMPTHHCLFYFRHLCVFLREIYTAKQEHLERVDIKRQGGTGPHQNPESEKTSKS